MACRATMTMSARKRDQLNAEERKPNSHEGIGLHVGHVDQRLTDAGNQDSGAQGVHRKAIDANGGHHETMAPNTGRFSTQLA